MKRTLVIVLLSFYSLCSYSQSDSSDLNLYMTNPILLDEMDSLMYDSSLYGELYLECNITDTVYFDGINIEISVASSNSVLYKGVFTKENLLTEGYLNSLWLVVLDLGKLEKETTYVISYVTKDINGVLGPVISKQFTYAGN